MHHRASLVAICLIAWFPPQTHAQPYPLPANAPSQAEHTAQTRRMMHDEYRWAYEALGHHNPAWDKLVDNLFEIYAARGSSDLLGPTNEDLRRAVEAVMATGCIDPLVANIASQITNHTVVPDHRVKEWNSRAFEGIRGKPYPPLLTFSELQSQGFQRLRIGDDSGTAIIDEALATLQKDARSGRIDLRTPAHQRRLAAFASHFLTNSASEKFTDAVFDALTSIPNLDSWTADMITGAREIELAWRARGVETASKTTQEQFAGHARHLRAARTAYVSAHRAKPDRPDAAVAMITLTMGNSEDNTKDIHYWFDEALNAEIDNPTAYNKYIYALMPKWLGSHEQLMELGQHAWNTQCRFDTTVPLYRFLIIKDIATDIRDFPAIWNDPYYYNIAAETLDVLIERPEWAHNRDFLLTLRAGMAYWTKNSDDFRAAWQRIERGLDHQALYIIWVEEEYMLRRASTLGLKFIFENQEQLTP